jgi:archaellum component FlaF (FlaF/FlaG flagellin family)
MKLTKTIHKSIILLLLNILLCMLIMPGVAQEPEINGYLADKPLTTYQHDTIKGGLIFTVGNSFYSGKLYPDDTYDILFSVPIPKTATVKTARLYNYWTWSAKGITGMYPEMKLTFDGNEISPQVKYDDRKQWGINDYPTGTWAYDVTNYVKESSSHTAVIENTGLDNVFVCMDGLGLLIVYTDENGNDIEYWINEGCDMLNSEMEDDGTPLFFTTPDQTTTEMMIFSIHGSTVKSAFLHTVIQSGNWDANMLIVNDMNFTGVCNGVPHTDLDIDERDITEYLVDGENIIQFRASGDYAIPSGSFLVVEKDPNAEGSVAVVTEVVVNTQDTATADVGREEDIPGFGVLFAVAMVLISTVVVRSDFLD